MVILTRHWYQLAYAPSRSSCSYWQQQWHWQDSLLLSCSSLTSYVAACCLVRFACNAAMHSAHDLVQVQMRAVLVFFTERITTGSSEHADVMWAKGKDLQLPGLYSSTNIPVNCHNTCARLVQSRILQLQGGGGVKTAARSSPFRTFKLRQSWTLCFLCPSKEYWLIFPWCSEHGLSSKRHWNS